MRKVVSFALVVALSLATMVPLNAQRTAARRFFAQAELGHGFSNPLALYGNAGMGQYLLNSYWEAGVHYGQRSSGLSTGGSLDYGQLYAYGAFAYRLFGTRNRTLNIYGGGGIFLGCEFHDPAGRLPDTLDLGFKDATFLYGLYPQVQVEYYLSDAVALLLSGRMPICLPNTTGIIKFEAGIGVRVGF